MLLSRHSVRTALALWVGVAFLASPLPGLAANSSVAGVTPVDLLDKVHRPLLAAPGTVEVSIRLTRPGLIEAVARGTKQAGLRLTKDQQRAQLSAIAAEQDRVVAAVVEAGGAELARVSKVLNAVIVQVDASALGPLAGLAEVRSIRPIAQYEKHLSDTVPHIGAAVAQSLGVTGAGVKVAVLDSGIDYTHRNLGGPGTQAAYQAAYGTGIADPRNRTRDGLFPTAKVVEGYDFVGELWPTFGPLQPDEDPIDFEGHGTHVADIIGGRSLDGLHVGVAPDVSLYAFKVCSAVSTSCSGIAILQGLEASLDPNGDGDITDAVDVVNMSLGASYGQMADDSAVAVQNLTEYGVAVVCSAGNSGDKLYVAGSPSIAPGAISVAQTQVPGAKAFILTLGGAGVPNPPVAIYNTASVDWAPVDTAVSGTFVAGGLACNPYPVGTDFTGKVVLIDRGACAISVKVDRAAKLGAAGVIIANNGPGDPPSFSFGGSSDANPFMPVPTLIITQADGNRIKSWLASGLVEASFDPGVFTPLVGSMVSTSSRGPSYDFDTIKPDIGAPGASLSAEAGTGTGETAFGGTSGAAPMVAGAAALVLEQYPSLQPHEVKARLMNAAYSDILINPISLPGVLAPVTRIGAGEVRADNALAIETLAYDADTGIASLSFGYHAPGAFGEPLKFKRKLTVKNLGKSKLKYTLAADFRDPADAASGAVAISFAPSVATLDPGQKVDVNVFLELRPAKLPDWSLDSGPNGGNGEALRAMEFDGHVRVTSGNQRIAVPWHILPHKAADNRILLPELALTDGAGSFDIRNLKGAVTGTSELFALTGTSPLDYPLPPAPGASIATPDLAAVGVRYLPDGGGALQFAIATHDERSHANYPAEFDVILDTDGNGILDRVIYNTELNGFAQTGQNVTVLAQYPSYATIGIYFYTDADLNSQAATLTVPLGPLGAGPNQPLGFLVAAFDNYFTGALADVIDDNGNLMRFTPAQPKFAVGSPSVDVAPGGTASVPVTYNAPGAPASPSQLGILAIHRDAKPGAWWTTLPVTAE
jgi:subtilisin family serine protease